MWAEHRLDAPWMHLSFEKFQRAIRGVAMFLALDAETRELLGMYCFRAHRREGWCYGFRLVIAQSAQHEGIASRMLAYVAERIRQAGYRYLKSVTATTAEWSVCWHLKNGYRIIGYYHAPDDNFANYVFRKQLIPISFSSPSAIAFILRHPVYALYSCSFFCRLRFLVAYAITCLFKDSQGQDNLLGRLARKLIHLKITGGQARCEVRRP